jgi:soluble lytic murein transglycosylase-like protein
MRCLLPHQKSCNDCWGRSGEPIALADSNSVRYLFALVLLLAASVAPASAQIYSWRDAQGSLVVSNRAREDSGEMVTYHGPGAKAVSAAPPLRTSLRGAEFDEAIEEHASAQGVSPELVRAVIQVESGFNSKAVSPKGAMGLMQLMPATARELGVINPFHPGENIRGGVAYLRQLLDRYDSNVELALAAYNAGPGSVEKYGAVPPYRETQAYVKKVTGASGPVAAAPPDHTIYKWIETVDGRAIVRYSNKPPKGVVAEPVGRR